MLLIRYLNLKPINWNFVNTWLTVWLTGFGSQPYFLCSKFWFTVALIPGNNNVVVDALSRNNMSFPFASSICRLLSNTTISSFGVINVSQNVTSGHPHMVQRLYRAGSLPPTKPIK